MGSTQGLADVIVTSNFLKPGDLRARLSVATAVDARHVPDDGGAPYELGAVVPDDVWSPLTDDAFERLCVDPEGDDRFFRRIGLMQAETRFVEAISALADAAGTTARSLRSSPPQVRAALHDAIRSTDGLTAVGPMLGVCRGRGRGGLRTVTVDAGPRRTGLHVDSWDGLGLSSRRRASNRIAINTGSEPRWFLFAPRQVATLAAENPDTDPLRAWAGSGQSALLCRLQVRPGEFYIAPTENLLHDGSTLGASAPDETLVVRGYIHFAGQVDP